MNKLIRGLFINNVDICCKMLTEQSMVLKHVSCCFGIRDYVDTIGTRAVYFTMVTVTRGTPIFTSFVRIYLLEKLLSLKLRQN